MDHMDGATTPMIPGKRPFDRAFVDEMVPHDEGAVRMARVVEAKGRDPELRSLARDVIAALGEEIVGDERLPPARVRVSGRGLQGPTRGHPDRQGVSMAVVRGYTATKEELLRRLARAEARSRVAKMVEEECYCLDVLTQISAAQAALDKTALGLLDDHTRHCLLGEGAGRSVPGEQADEVMAAVGRLLARRRDSADRRK